MKLKLIVPAHMSPKLSINVSPDLHVSAALRKYLFNSLVSKQLNDKERVQAAIENPEIIQLVFPLLFSDPSTDHLKEIQSYQKGYSELMLRLQSSLLICVNKPQHEI